jgi:hypothetical protein
MLIIASDKGAVNNVSFYQHAMIEFLAEENISATDIFYHLQHIYQVKLIFYTVHHDATIVIFHSLHSLHVLATLSHLQVFGPKSFTLHFLVFAFKP